MVDFIQVCRNLLPDVYEGKRFLKETKNAHLHKYAEHEPLIRLKSKSSKVEFLFRDQSLARHRKHALMLLDHLTTQKKKLHEDEEEFQRRFIEFNELVHVNKHKRERAILRHSEYEIYSEEQIARTGRLLGEVLKLRQYKRKMLEEIQKHYIYENFITSTLYDFGPKAKVNDVLLRFGSLVSERRYLTERSKNVNNQFSEMCQKHLKLIADYIRRVMEMNALISQMAVVYDEATRKTLHLEDLIIDVKNCYDSRFEDLITSVQSIYNLNGFMQERLSLCNLPSRHFVIADENTPVLDQELLRLKNVMGALSRFIKKLMVARKLWEFL